MIKLSGTLEVFQNRNGFVTGVFKAWNEEDKSIEGKAYMDVTLPDSVKVEEGQTLTLNVKTAYLNAVHVKSNDAEFTKLKINVVDCEVKSVFPEKKAEKPSKKASK